MIRNAPSRLGNVISDQVGGWQDPCTAGGLLCPQPQSSGASLNPCCWSSAASTTSQVDDQGNPVVASPLGLPTAVTGVNGVPAWGWLLALGVGVIALVRLKP